MVLDYIIDNFVGVEVLHLDLTDICKIIGTTGDGTIFEDVENMNKDKRILKVVPSIEFIVKKEHHELDDIENELSKGRPVIAWIHPRDAVDRDLDHSVVITNLDKEGYRIYFNDPFLGEREMSLGDFMDCWDLAERILIKIKVGERIQRLLEEYAEKPGVKP
jgi:hypothetical protein